MTILLYTSDIRSWKIHLFAMSKAENFELVITRDTQGVAASNKLKSTYLISDVCLLHVLLIKSVVSQSYLKCIFFFNCVIMIMTHCSLLADHKFSRSTLNYIYVCISFNLLFLLIFLITEILWWEEIIPSFFRNITQVFIKTWLCISTSYLKQLQNSYLKNVKDLHFYI